MTTAMLARLLLRLSYMNAEVINHLRVPHGGILFQKSKQGARTVPVGRRNSFTHRVVHVDI